MRLIDADAIKYTEYINGDITVSKEEIERQQTAYDIDKVVEQIKSAKDEDNMVCYINNKPVIEKEQAIEIVKQGGVSDDVCEWKKSEKYPFDWIVGCDGRKVNHRQGNYCPRCGKKIKVVY